LTDEEELKELRLKQEIRRRKQNEAWERWYKGPKGQAHKLKMKLAYKLKNEGKK
jgi:uncharacterized protein YdaU (DUF1376 family)